MLRILFATSFIALLACGSGESNQGAGDMPPVSAADPATDDVQIERIEVEANAAAAAASSCLKLVKSRAFEEALPVCTEAAANDPENTKVQAALARAQAKTQASGAAANALDAAVD